MHTPSLGLLVLALSTLLAGSPAAVAQQVYRCEADGKVSYSHEPCLGAIAIDTTPTQGMDTMTGQRKKGADVQREEHRKILSDIAQKINGVPPVVSMTLMQRQHLSRTAQAQCATWDLRLPGFEKDVQQATSPKAREKAELALLHARQAFRDLRC